MTAPAADGVVDLGGGGFRVADGDDHALAPQRLDVGGRSGPFRRQGHQAHEAAGGFLPAVELVKIGRPDPGRRVRAARSVFGGEVRSFDVEALHGGAFREGFAGVGQVAQRTGHLFGRAGDDGRQAPGDSGGEHGAQAAGEVLVGSGGIVVVDAREAVHLEVDEAGREEGKIRRRGEEVFDGADPLVEFDLDGGAGEGINAMTVHRRPVLFTVFPQGVVRKSNKQRSIIVVDIARKAPISAGVQRLPAATNRTDPLRARSRR
jgi:hypothetical protein